jgi:hypothetical protein
MRASLALGLLLAVPASAMAQAISAAQERALKAGDSFKDCEACPEMVVVPAGAFDGLAGPGRKPRRQ